MINDNFEGFVDDMRNESLDGPNVKLPVWMERGTRTAAQLMHMPLDQYVTVALCLQNLVVLSTDEKQQDIV